MPRPAISQRIATAGADVLPVSRPRSPALIGSFAAERIPRRVSQTMTMTRPVTSTTSPSTRLRKESRNSDTVSSDTASNAGISRRSVAEFKFGIGFISAVRRAPGRCWRCSSRSRCRPRGRVRRAEAAMMETRISGAEVANATIVRPISNGATPRLRAVAAAPCTKRSAPKISRARPAAISAKIPDHSVFAGNHEAVVVSSVPGAFQDGQYYTIEAACKSESTFCYTAPPSTQSNPGIMEPAEITKLIEQGLPNADRPRHERRQHAFRRAGGHR